MIRLIIKIHILCFTLQEYFNKRTTESQDNIILLFTKISRSEKPVLYQHRFLVRRFIITAFNKPNK